MKDIYNQIIENTKKISVEQEYFSLPEIENAEVKIEDLEATGSTLLKRRYIIENEDGKIEIMYESKDKCRVHQINPDWNKVEIIFTDKNGKIESFTDGWSDKM
ncbi:hypothetical protein [Chryseobacterium gambrini]|uniref:Uncharacterized protein n=1 Tax=Chryseobacterium gambrini TaxID=373672 RepID=A0A1N7LL05_9FLAO|nr:hypothetical protein [Chryseobacterium gambrini]SIS74518.1 hypothetical protein SAMN05421785_102314 [Chryseobacterium gambrini]